MTSVIDERATEAPAAPSRLLPPAGPGRPPDRLDDHLRRWGPAAGLDDPRGSAAAGLIDAVAAAGLRGRGGGGFPTAAKLRAVAGAGGRRAPVVVVNAAESEPASAKDQALMTGAPHLVLDGAQLAAAAIGARRITVAVHRGDPAADSLAAAVHERTARWPAAAPVEIAQLPRRYVASQETALVRWLSGGEARPTVAPPRPSERGVGKHPTLVQNAETLADLALIGRFGPTWFRSVGTPDEPGTRLFTVSGAVADPGVYELAGGARGAEVLARAGGGPGGVQAVLVGGYGGRWVSTDGFRAAPLTTGRGPGTVALGAGVVIALPPDGCGVRETARLARWLADQSAGQCGPCAFGLPAISAQLTALAAGWLDRGGVATLERWAGQIRGRGACAHPDGVTQLVTSALTVFAAEVDQHVTGRCSARPEAPPVCPLPTGDEAEPWR